ncbi:Kinesin-like protein KIF19 [Vulpes lagopus]
MPGAVSALSCQPPCGCSGAWPRLTLGGGAAVGRGLETMLCLEGPLPESPWLYADLACLSSPAARHLDSGWAACSTVCPSVHPQEDVYHATTQHLVEGVVSGYNATVFAYGPSGAGKTYTMLGMDAEPGIYLQTLADLFRAIEEIRDSADCSVSMSYLEIYNEVIRDLLNPSSGFLDLREDSRGSIQIAGIMEVSTSNAQEIMQLLTKGNRQRTQEPTATNKTSSRSHAVLQVTVRQRSRGPDLVEEVRVGKLFMVDLAGSERASQVL